MVVDKFTTILENTKVHELIPFLKSLSKQDKKELASAVKILAKEYLEYRMIKKLVGSTYEQKAKPEQVKIITYTAFVCLNRKEYEKINPFSPALKEDFFREILPWYCPEWFSDFVNNFAKNEWIPWYFTYDLAMELTELGYLKPSNELIVRLIPQMIFSRSADNKYLYAPQELEKREITLREHFWMLFQFETTINYSDRYLQFRTSDNADQERWISAIKSYVEGGKIDRMRLLRESLLASSRNFNKTLSGWFIDLFEYLKPSKTELIYLQSELFVTLNSQHSKAVNTCLNCFKEVADSPDFNVRSLMENIPLLLSSETKSVVVSTIQLLDKVVKNHPDKSDSICLGICQAYINNDESIQTRASKFLLKYNQGASELVRSELNLYKDSMLMSSRIMLKDFLELDSTNEFDAGNHNDSSSDELRPIDDINTLDQLVFLASQAFDNNKSFHIDILPAALVNLREEITGETLAKLEPALQRAYKTVMADWPATMGYLDHLLATFFIDITKVLIKEFPESGKTLLQIHEEFKLKDEKRKKESSWYQGRILEFEGWKVASGDSTYFIHKTILLNAFEKISLKDRTPLLSTPTHESGYLDPLVFVNRLAIYQQMNVVPEDFDFQIAVTRIAPIHHEEALLEARQKTGGETLRILEFILQKDVRPVGPFDSPSVWFLAGVIKSAQHKFPEFKDMYYTTLPESIFTGDVEWKSFKEHFTTKRYDYQKKAQVEIADERKVLKLTINQPQEIEKPSIGKSESLFDKFSSWISAPLFRKKEKRTVPYLTFEFLSLKGKTLSAEYNDIERVLSLFPSNPDPILALVLSKCMVYSKFWEESDRKMVTETIKALNNLVFNYGSMTHLFIGTCMLSDDKTIRSFAAELWIKGVKYKKVSSQLIGEIIGTHESIEFAPLKRFTELISSNLINLSPNHNKELQNLLTHVLLQLPEQPINNLKKLLELYSEIMLLNRSKVYEEGLITKLRIWNGSANLKKVSASLLA